MLEKGSDTVIYEVDGTLVLYWPPMEKNNNPKFLKAQRRMLPSIPILQNEFMLTHIDLSHNNIKSMLGIGSYPKGLQSLNLSYNCIENVKCIEELSKL